MYVAIKFPANANDADLGIAALTCPLNDPSCRISFLFSVKVIR